MDEVIDQRNKTTRIFELLSDDSTVELKRELWEFWKAQFNITEELNLHSRLQYRLGELLKIGSNRRTDG